MANRKKSLPKQRKRAVTRRPPSRSSVPLVVPMKLKHIAPLGGQLGIANTVVISPGNSVIQTFGAYSTRLNDIPNFATLTALYDQYRITGVDIVWQPMYADTIFFTPNSPHTVQFGTAYVYAVLDFDDSTTPVNVDQILSRPNARVLRLDGERSLSYKPKVTFIAEDTGTTPFRQVPQSGVWVDCTNPNIDHMGVKWAHTFQVCNNDTLPTSHYFQCQVMVTYHLEFRYPRLG